MKYIKIKIILCALLVGGPLCSYAQNDILDESSIPGNDSVSVKDDMVQLIFHKENKKDILGGVSEVMWLN